MARAWPVVPSPDRTLHLLGDLHVGAVAQVRLDKTMADVNGLVVPDPVAHLQVGDIVQNGLASEDITAQTYLDGLPSPCHVLCGNHDLNNGVRTAATWETTWGSRNYNADLGFARLIGVGPDTVSAGSPAQVTLTQATLDWLDAELAAATKDCIVACHAPLKASVSPVDPTAGEWSSSEAGFYVEPDTSLRTILGNRSRAKVYVAGHTHSPLNATGFTKLETVGSRQIISVNASAIYYVGRTVEALTDPIPSLYLTWQASTIEFRGRDHGAGVWIGPGSTERVVSYSIPA